MRKKNGGGKRPKNASKVPLSIESFLVTFTQPFYSASQLFCESTDLRVVSKVSRNE